MEGTTCHVLNVVGEPLVAVNVHHRDELEEGNQGKTSGAKAGEKNQLIYGVYKIIMWGLLIIIRGILYSKFQDDGLLCTHLSNSVSQYSPAPVVNIVPMLEEIFIYKLHLNICEYL